MKLIIEENNFDKEDLKNSSYFDKPSTPLTYRVSIRLNEDHILLKREYFFVGYLSGESPDEFYFNDEDNWYSSYITYTSFITRNFDTKYLKDKENELINKFFDKLNITKEKIKEDKKEKIEYFNNRIKFYNECLDNDVFIKLKRKLKIKEIEK